MLGLRTGFCSCIHPPKELLASADGVSPSDPKIFLALLICLRIGKLVRFV